VPPPIRPPSWPTLITVSIAHGLALGGLLLGIAWAAPWVGFDITRLLIVTVAVASFAVLLVVLPYKRTAAIATWLSPLAAWTVLALAAGSWRPTLSAAPGILLLAGFHLVTNLVTAAAMFPTLKFIDRLPVADPTLCSNCGYSLSGIDSDRCPECGHRISPTPDA
jgi:hypothetical protein